jgi:hypothetical protein
MEAMAGWSKRDQGRHDNCELERPDRTRVGARRKDIPKSGKAWDSFPSGHAVHVGALAAAATRMAPQHASHVRSSALALAGTPILLLAHHLTDVIAGCLRLSAVRSVDRRSPSGPRVAGAVWCSVSHALRAGVYHASVNAKLRFNGADVTPKVNAAGLRRLAGVPTVANVDEAGWETRKTGSAALECALVAAGLLEVPRLAAPNLWHVAGGPCTHRSRRWCCSAAGWSRLDAVNSFVRDNPKLDLRQWRHPLVVGTREAVERMCVG